MWDLDRRIGDSGLTVRNNLGFMPTCAEDFFTNYSRSLEFYLDYSDVQ